MRRPDRVRFEADKIFPLSSFSSYNKRDIFQRYQSLLGINQQYMCCNENERRLDRGHLVPVADFITNPLMASTFKMINVIPQFHSINAGNWNIIEEWVRHPSNTPARVCSGVLPYVLKLSKKINSDSDMSVSQDSLVALYLQEKNRIPVPLWTYKIVRSFRNVRTVFLQYNNIYDNQPPTPPAGLCRPIVCPSTIKLRNVNFFGYTFCCDEKHFLDKNAPHLINYC